jgi:cell division inhibitor SepF
MKLWDKIVKGVNPDDEDHFNDVFEDDEMYDQDGGMGGSGDLSDFISGGYSNSNSPYGGPAQNQNQGYSQPQQVYQQPSQQPSPSNSNSGGITVSGGANMQLSVELKVIKPEDYQDVTQIADHLINRKTVILNLEETNKETARRLLDFLSGVAYTIQGQIERVADRTFVITPSNIGISSDQLKEDPRKNSGRPDNNIY